MNFETEYPFYASTSQDTFWSPAVSESVGEGGSYLSLLGKQGSHTPTSSIVNIGPKITTTTAGTTGSFVMVHKRAGSNISNEILPERSDKQGVYSLPSLGSAAEWNHSEHAIDLEVDDEIYRMPHDPKAILFNMSGPGTSGRRAPKAWEVLTKVESAPGYNPYSLEARLSTDGNNSPAPQDYSPDMHASSTAASIVNPPQHGMSYSRPSMLTDASDAPWTHMHPRGSHRDYEQSFVGFTPSPGPAAEQDDVQRNAATFQVIEFAADSNSKIKKPNTKVRRPKPISKGKAKATEHGWEHHSVIQRGGLQLMTKPEENPTQRPGIRRGKLDPDAAEKARKIRRMTACWNCWIQKVPVGVEYLVWQIPRWSPPSVQLASHAKDVKSNMLLGLGRSA
jgi:hypothetical protein